MKKVLGLEKECLQGYNFWGIKCIVFFHFSIAMHEVCSWLINFLFHFQNLNFNQWFCSNKYEVLNCTFEWKFISVFLSDVLSTCPWKFCQCTIISFCVRHVFSHIPWFFRFFLANSTKFKGGYMRLYMCSYQILNFTIS